MSPAQIRQPRPAQNHWPDTISPNKALQVHLPCTAARFTTVFTENPVPRDLAWRLSDVAHVLNDALAPRLKYRDTPKGAFRQYNTAGYIVAWYSNRTGDLD